MANAPRGRRQAAWGGTFRLDTVAPAMLLFCIRLALKG